MYSPFAHIDAYFNGSRVRVGKKQTTKNKQQKYSSKTLIWN